MLTERLTVAISGLGLAAVGLIQFAIPMMTADAGAAPALMVASAMMLGALSVVIGGVNRFG